MNHFGGQNLYITNVVDNTYSQTSTADMVLEAQELLGFMFKIIQCDNGREFGKKIENDPR